ncbi:hypothetical protein HPB47_016144 [Ixodes persulcatus]|uniref:Uncharacterized protein n=1 Tax=Ixodes persulcatus TaxID=34615 RepID=A0AC60QRL7_IXOPE|nr:hypothetical protein HPB47_016144 [Ixodes persulcatus]
MGDFNGHLVELDGREDNNGTMMRQLAEDVELEILNLREDCEGQHTWMVRDRRTCIDYALASKRLGSNLQKVVVDEEGEWSVSSDHNSIFLHFGTVRGTPSRSQPKVVTQLREDDIFTVVQTFDESTRRMHAISYDDFAIDLRTIIANHSTVKSARGKRRLVPWWDVEIKRSIQVRQEANRRYRQALKTLGKTTLTLQLWEEYRKCKIQTQDTVEAKIQAHDCKVMADIKDAGKKAVEKFWRYLGSLAGKDSTPELLDYDSGYPVQNIGQLLETQLHILFGVADVEISSENWKTESRIIEDVPS